MMQLLMLLALAAQNTPAPTTGDRVIFRDPIQGPTAVTDKFLIPPKIPDCRTDAQIQQALAQRANGELESCDLPKAYRRR